MSFEMMLKQSVGGMQVSTRVFMATLVFPLPLGLVVAFGRILKNPVICAITEFYIPIMYETPLMLQLMVVYSRPYYLFGIEIKSNNFRLWVALIGLVVNYAVYLAEVYRSGIQSISVGQYEAAKLLGYNRGQTFSKIILPQIIKRILPLTTNEVITLVKGTSLAFVISVIEMFSIAKALTSFQMSMISFVTTGLFYYIFNLLVAVIMERVEKRLSYYQ